MRNRGLLVLAGTIAILLLAQGPAASRLVVDPPRKSRPVATGFEKALPVRISETALLPVSRPIPAPEPLPSLSTVLEAIPWPGFDQACRTTIHLLDADWILDFAEISRVTLVDWIERDPALVPPFNPQVKTTAEEFLAVYLRYTGAVEHALMGTRRDNATFRELTRRRRNLSRKHMGDYQHAMKAANSHIAEFRSGIGQKNIRDRSYLLVQKSNYLVYVMDSETREAYAAFPVGVGTLPGPKHTRGDLRTPECPPRRRSPTTSPFFVGPVLKESIWPKSGVISSCIGVDSGQPGYDYLEKGWCIMFHGTPDSQSMGTRSSLGCVRMLPEHIALLYEYVRPKAPIVIVP